jgi:hypothetical protein
MTKCLALFLAMVICLCWVGSACSEQSGNVNLLRNATFQRQTNKGLPDYWDLHHVAAVTFKNLYGQYGIDETAVSPVSDARVLKVTNPEEGFPFLMLWATRFDSPLPGGEYTFSVYIRADRRGAVCALTNGGDAAQSISYRLSTDWKRLSATFRTDGPDSGVQPVLFFKSKGSYYVAAPQLEKGVSVSPFQPETNAELREMAIADRALSDERTLRVLAQNDLKNSPLLTPVFEYDYYTNDSSARLFVTSNHRRTLSLKVSCGSPGGKLSNIGSFTLRPESETTIDVPLVEVPEGEFNCTVKAFVGNALSATAVVKSQKKTPSASEVRVNLHRRFISINKQPFQIIGMATNFRPPDWYFKDLAEHGFNTIFFEGPLAVNAHDIAAAKTFLDRAMHYGLKVMAGLPLEGDKPPDWRSRLSDFSRFVAIFRNHPAILGWWAYDEPHSTWKESELSEVYQTVKAADPYHLVSGNWCDIPKAGKEPFGTFLSTDIYSHDYYPFTFADHTLYGFGNNSYYVSQTARMKNKLSHVFIQLYGDINAWREPTGDELNFMTVLALMNGSMTTYWDTKSNCSETWNRIGIINNNTRALSSALFLDPAAREIRGVTIQGNFLYSLWQKGTTVYAIILSMKNSSEPLSLDVSGFANSTDSRIAMFLGNGPDRLVKGSIVDSLGPYEAKVYMFDRS